MAKAIKPGEGHLSRIQMPLIFCVFFRNAFFTPPSQKNDGFGRGFMQFASFAFLLRPHTRRLLFNLGRTPSPQSLGDKAG